MTPAQRRDMAVAILPNAALENHIAILGKTGSGKSNAAKVLVETLLDRGERVCVIDPTGTWYGLRIDAQGKRPSKFPIVIFGGLKGDLAIEAGHGAAIAETIGTTSTPAIIDTRQMTVGARTRFFTAFAETLIQKNEGALHLVIDEAHLFAPQSGGTGGRDVPANQMLHAANSLVSLGRGLGLRIMMLSQRPAKLHKDSLTQVETLVAMRVIAPHDTGAVRSWIKEWADPVKGEEIVASLPSLPTGDAWVWSPELNFLERVHFPIVATFDSGRPLRAGEPGPKLGTIDLGAVAARLEEVGKEVLENDPARMRKRIAELERAVREKPAAGLDPGLIEEAERRGYARGRLDAFHRAANDVNRTAEQVRQAGEQIAAMLEGVHRGWSDAVIAEHAAIVPSRPAPNPRIPPPVKTANSGSKPGAEMRLLRVLAERWPARFTRAQLGTLAGLSWKGGTFGTYLSRLRTAGHIDEAGGLIQASETGLQAAGVEPGQPQTTEQVLAQWVDALGPGAAGKLLRTLADHGDWLSRDDLAGMVGMTASGGTFGTYLSRLRSNGLLEDQGRMVRVCDVLRAG